MSGLSDQVERHIAQGPKRRSITSEWLFACPLDTLWASG